MKPPMMHLAYKFNQPEIQSEQFNQPDNALSFARNEDSDAIVSSVNDFDEAESNKDLFDVQNEFLELNYDVDIRQQLAPESSDQQYSITKNSYDNSEECKNCHALRKELHQLRTRNIAIRDDCNKLRM